MMPEDPNPPTQHLPPTEPGEIGDGPALPGWPKPVGIISIVLASLSLTCAGCGAVSTLMSPVLMKMAGAQGGPIPPALNPTITTYIQMFLGFLWAALLLIAGIVTLQRKYAGRTIHLVYAIGAVPLLVWSIMTQLDIAAKMSHWAQQNPGSPFAQSQSQAGTFIGIGIAVLFGLPWPVFCLIWFGFVKKRPDDFTGGRMVDQL